MSLILPTAVPPPTIQGSIPATPQPSTKEETRIEPYDNALGVPGENQCVLFVLEIPKELHSEDTPLPSNDDP
jgi:hypothetical protein